MLYIAYRYKYFTIFISKLQVLLKKIKKMSTNILHINRECGIVKTSKEKEESPS